MLKAPFVVLRKSKHHTSSHNKQALLAAWWSHILVVAQLRTCVAARDSSVQGYEVTETNMQLHKPDAKWNKFRRMVELGEQKLIAIMTRRDVDMLLSKLIAIVI